jgi:hypothetical protein
MRWTRAIPLFGVSGVGVAAGAYLGTVTGALTLDLQWGRRTRPLGPLQIDIAAPPDTVFDVLAQPYLERQTRAMAEKVQILERGTDMVLAAHRTPLSGGLVATTVETVRFSRPTTVDFRVTRGPVPYVVETVRLTHVEGGTRLAYTGELGADLWAVGAWWAKKVARPWEAVVAATFASVRTEAERRQRASTPRLN